MSSPTSSELEDHRQKNMEKNAWAMSEEVCLRMDDSLAPQGFISAFLVDKPENLFLSTKIICCNINTTRLQMLTSLRSLAMAILQNLSCSKTTTVKMENFT